MSTLHKIKAIVFLLLALMLLVSPAKAQFTDDQSKSPDERAEILTSWMQANLDLTDAQIKKVKSINLTAATQMKNAKKEFGKDLEGFIERGKEIDKEHNIKLRDALNPMQWSKYQKFRDGNNKGKEPEVVTSPEDKKI